MKNKDSLCVIRRCVVNGDNIDYFEDYVSLGEIKRVIYSPKFIDVCSFLNGRELNFKLPVLKVSFDRRYLDENLLGRVLSCLFKGLELSKYAVWVIGIGGIQISFDEFVSIFKIINGFKVWKEFLFSICIKEDLKYEIELYLLLY